MVGDFDAYHHWLGIPPSEQPPHYYRLLGVQVFEEDGDVIASAADRQMGHLRLYQAGQHRELAQKLLNEVAAARVCLLHARKKAAYDESLRVTAAVASEGVAVDDPPEWADFAASTSLRTVRKSSGARMLFRLAGVLVFGVVGVAIAAGVWNHVSTRRVDPPTDPKPPVANATHPKPALPENGAPGGAGKEKATAAGKETAIGGATTDPPPGSPTITVQPTALSGSSEKTPSPPTAVVASSDADKAKASQAAWANRLGVPVEWTNSIGMTFCLIPPGEFAMGSTEQDVERLRNRTKQPWYIERLPSEAPQHRVRLTQAFYLGRCEVTQAQYQQVMGSNPSKLKQSGPEAPVEMVHWNDAVDFCRRLSALPAEKDAGGVYRLPSEAEWEYAARAGTTTAWSFGDAEAGLLDSAWWGGNSAGKTHRVAEKRPNGFGLFDVHGNVWEWCADWFSADYYAKSPTNNPVGPDSGTSRALRGGSWFIALPDHFRCASRHFFDPKLPNEDIGFRAVRILAVDAMTDATDPPDKPLQFSDDDPAKTKAGKQSVGKAKGKGGKTKADDEADGDGDPESAEAMRLGLKWLVKQQRADGSWTFQTAPNPGSYTNSVAATSMALLPLLRARQSTPIDKERRDAVAKGLAYLTGHAKPAGPLAFDLRGGMEDGMYAHAVGTLALCYACAGNKNPRLRTMTQGAVNFIVAAQDPKGGGWRYRPRQSGDTSSLAWQMSALVAAKELKHNVPPVVWLGAGKFLDSVQSDDGRSYGYERPGSGSPAMTAVGLLCRTQLGWTKKTPALRDGIATMAAAGPWDDVYYNLYATRLMHWWGGQEGDQDWKKWREAMRAGILRSQEPSGDAQGSWFGAKGFANRYPSQHFIDESAGRLGATSLQLLILSSVAEQ